MNGASVINIRQNKVCRLPVPAKSSRASLYLAYPMRFECQSGCTKCCEQQGFVYLTEDDILRLAGFLDLKPTVFERRFVYRTKNLRRLRVPRLAQCPFLKTDGCSVHVAKPLQCRTFPFWPEMVDSKREWLKTGSWCPGIGKGPLVKIEAARAIADTMRDGSPLHY
jgi:Fe-S-cluster containining protein